MDLNLSFYFNCTSYPPTLPSIQCLNIGSYQSYVFVENHETEGYDWSKNCQEKVVVPVTQTQINIDNLISGLGGAMNDGFVLNWERAKDCGKCVSSQGYCGHNAPAEEFLCFCNNGSINSNSCKGPIRTKKLKLIIGVAASGVGVLLTCIIIFWFRSKRSIIKSTKFRTKKTKNEQDLEAFIRDYGMMILEMAGGRNNIDVGVSQTSEIYFPHWIYKRLELDNDIGFLSNMTTAENEMVRKMILVGLWCIQTNPSDRPSMSKVIEMIEGNIEALKIPPKPFLCSPPRSHAEESSTTSIL
ncbi:hypothetical protein CMV_005509 [Castanea mollissima]|uniref:Wall-associated receptor kinase C-terminal domain-containing protein n=1 Tax=Castanea mollissima TaxID=60419 RepID=A0A8J4RXM5_9ROSI|nr:hypothetical protein CMV_005509 [Castanea mollissima]